MRASLRLVSALLVCAAPALAFADDPAPDAPPPAPAEAKEEAPAEPKKAPAQIDTAIYTLSAPCTTTAIDKIKEAFGFATGVVSVKQIALEVLEVNTDHSKTHQVLDAVVAKIKELGYGCERTRAIGATVENERLRVQAACAQVRFKPGTEGVVVVGLFPRGGHVIGGSGASTKIAAAAQRPVLLVRDATTWIRPIQEDRKLFQFPVRIPPEAEPGTYLVDITVTYKAHKDGKAATDEVETHTIQIPIDVVAAQ